VLLELEVSGRSDAAVMVIGAGGGEKTFDAAQGFPSRLIESGVRADEIADHLPGGDIERAFGRRTHGERNRTWGAEADTLRGRFLPWSNAHGLGEHVNGDGLVASFEFAVAAQAVEAFHGDSRADFGPGRAGAQVCGKIPVRKRAARFASQVRRVQIRIEQAEVLTMGATFIRYRVGAGLISANIILRDRRGGLSAAGWITLFLNLSTVLVTAQADSKGQVHLDSGEKIYQAGCAACHGADGRGTAKTIAGFEPPDTFPDFTRCDQTTAEPDSTWKAIITHGGPYRGFAQIMPSFSQALTSKQIDQVIQYLRGFCKNPHWARGELNLPRALVTEKAYPENEVVISSAVNGRGAAGVSSDVIHEQRFGVKNQIEIDVPITFQDQNHVWYGGVGDTTVGWKREIFSSLRAGSIFSLQGSVIIPSGNKDRGFGSGTTTFETFAAFDELFPSHTFLQFQMGADLPRHTDISAQTVFWRTAVGRSFGADHGLGRVWSPMMEFLADKELGAKTDWDVLPQMQVTISRRQHIRGDLGVRVPVNNTAGRPVQLMLYLLWDWGDGKLNEGW